MLLSISELLINLNFTNNKVGIKNFVENSEYNVYD